MSAHAILAPSAAARWVACAGSVALAALFPETESGEEAREGEAAHWAAFEILHASPVAVGQVAPNGYVLTEEMIEGAQEYADAIDKELAERQLTRAVLVVERRVNIFHIHAQNWGTPDCWFYDPVRKTLVMFDFKFGHRMIEVFECWQLVDYVAGVAVELGLDDLTNAVKMVIVQPRSFHRDGPVREWLTRLSDLRAQINILTMAAERALEPGAKCTPNPECEYCPARHACEAVQHSAYRAVALSKGSTPLVLSPAAVGLELRTLEAAEQALAARISGLKAQAVALFKGGAQVPGWAMVPTSGREAWREDKPLAELLQLGTLFGIDLAKPAAITPTQARKKGMPEEVIAQYAGKPSRGLALERDDGSTARRVFGKNTY